MTTHTLYRCFCADGTLLYVGASLSAINRLAHHKATTNWFNSICEVKLEHYENRETALAAETLAIRNEKPKHNVINARPRPKVSRNCTSDGRVVLFIRVEPELLRRLDAVALRDKTDRTRYMRGLMEKYLP